MQATKRSHISDIEVCKAVLLFQEKRGDFPYEILAKKFNCDENRGSAELLVKQIELARQEGEKAGREKTITEDTSDGYHTFKELYDFRLLYNAHLFNEWAKQGMYDVHKSQRHADGELCFGRNDYFVVVATLPTGQISNHYPMSDWDLFMCEAVEMAKHTWDGHTSQDVAQRLREALTNPTRALIEESV